MSWRRPWPRRRDRKAAVAEAERAYRSAVRQRPAVEASIAMLRQARELNGFREQFQTTLEGR